MWTFPLHWELGSISFTEISRFESQPHERVLLSLCHPRDSAANNRKQKPTSHNKDTVCRMCMWDLGIWMVLGMSCKIAADTGLNLALGTWNCCVETFEVKHWWFQRNFHSRWDVATLCNAVTNASIATSLHSALKLHKGLFPADYVQLWQRLSAWACTCPWQVCLGGTAVTGIERVTGPNSAVP